MCDGTFYAFSANLSLVDLQYQISVAFAEVVCEVSEGKSKIGE